MIHHASYELREAIEGVPPAGIDREGADPFSEYELPACGDSLGPTSKAALAYLWRGATDVEEAEWFEDPTPIDCPDCLRLLECARGPERTAELLVYADQLEGVVAALDAVVAEGPAPEMTTAERTAILRSHNVARSKLRAIQSANLFTPGESAARRKTA